MSPPARGRFQYEESMSLFKISGSISIFKKYIKYINIFNNYVNIYKKYTNIQNKYIDIQKVY